VTGVTSWLVMRSLLCRQPCTVIVAVGSFVDAKEPRLRDRLAARWRSGHLDRDLAGGIPPEASAALALRAQHLTEPEQRRSIAQALRRIVREAHERRPVVPGRVTPSRAAVSAAREELSLLADALDEPGPVAAGGVAQASLLLTDGTGPLYNRWSGRSLGAGAAHAARDLRPWAA
jgi:hypothetical protein